MKGRFWKTALVAAAVLMLSVGVSVQPFADFLGFAPVTVSAESSFDVPGYVPLNYMVVMDVAIIGYSDETKIEFRADEFERRNWKVIRQDLNDGAGGMYIYLAYKTAVVNITQDSDISISDAIKDIIIVKGSEYGEQDTLTDISDTTLGSSTSRTFHKCLSYGDLNSDEEEEEEKDKGNLNRGTGSETPDLYLYYTRDAGNDNTVVRRLYINTSSSGSAYCYNNSGNSADLNPSDNAAYLHLGRHNVKAGYEGFTAYTDFVYNGSAQQLATPKRAYHGTVYWRVNGGAWTTDLPMATDAGTYTVESYVKGEYGYADSSVLTATVTIEPKCGDNAYWSFDSATGKLTISGTGAMWDYSNLSNQPPWKRYSIDITSVEIKNGITSIGANAFNTCRNLKSITIPNSVTSITDGAFRNCAALTSITIPNSVTSIGYYAFDGCTGITDVYCYADPDNLTWNENGCNDFKAGKETICHIPAEYNYGYHRWFKNSLNVTFKVNPAEVNPALPGGKCGENAVWEFDPVTHKLTISGTGTMYDCVYDDNTSTVNTPWFAYKDNITSVVIGYGVTSIGRYAFDGCINLTSVTIPNGVTSIGDSAFEGCTSLKSISIPDSVTSIGGDAFQDCTNLTSVEIPNSVTSIGNYAFDGCTNLTSVEIPNSVESIGEGAFRNCTALTSVEVPKNVTSIGTNAFQGCESLTSATILGSVTTISNNAFSGCTELKSVKIPDSVTSIGRGAFRNCAALTSITIPNSVTSIGSEAFLKCTSLTSISIPAKVTNIGANAFYGCTNIIDVYCYADPKNLTWDESRCDDFKSGKETICYVPGNYLDNYNEYFDGSVNVKFEKNPESLLGGKCGENARWEFDPTTRKLTISGTGDMDGFGRGAQPWKDHMSYITSVVIEDGITSIGTEAFDSCAALTSITIPDSVKSIGNYVFQSCTNLTSIAIPDSVTSIGSHLFYGCTSLTSVEIPNSVTTISGSAFRKCTALTSVEIPNSVTSIDIAAFDGCTDLASITIPNSVTTISSSAFRNCTALTSVEIPTSVTSISSAFQGCTSLTSITIPNSVTSIGSYAFQGCISLTSVEIPAKVTNIGEDAFRSCTGITDVYCYADPKNLTWNERNCNDFKPGKETVCHVPAEHLGYYQTNFKDVNVKFATDVTVTVADGITNGTVTPDKTEVYSGETVKLTVAPYAGYAVKRVTVNGTELEAVNGVYSFTAPAENVTVSAEFEKQKCAVTLPDNMEIINGDVLTEGKADYGTEIIFKVSDGYTASNVKNGETELIPDVSGIYTVTVEGDTVITADITQELYELRAYGLRLNSDIGLDVYFSIDDSVIKDVTRMDITLPNQQIETVYATDFYREYGLYRFSAKVAAKEMTDKVRFELYTNDTAPVYTADVSVKDAAQQYLDSKTQTENTKALVMAMLNYGAYSQEYFRYRTNDPAIIGEVLPTVDYTEIGTAFDNEKIKLPDDGSISFTGVNLSLESNTSLVFTITNSSANTLTYELEGNTGRLEVKEEVNETKLIITDIPAENLADDFIVKIKVNGEGDYQVYYSPMTYARYCVKNNRAEKDVMLAFYEYCRCAKDYETK